MLPVYPTYKSAIAFTSKILKFQKNEGIIIWGDFIYWAINITHPAFWINMLSLMIIHIDLQLQLNMMKGWLLLMTSVWKEKVHEIMSLSKFKTNIEEY